MTSQPSSKFPAELRYPQPNRLVSQNFGALFGFHVSITFIEFFKKLNGVSMAGYFVNFGRRAVDWIKPCREQISEESERPSRAL